MNYAANEMPTVTSAGHTHSVYQGANMGNLANYHVPSTYTTCGTSLTTGGSTTITLQGYGADSGLNFLKQHEVNMSAKNGAAKLRVVRVFLVDPDERVPVEKRVLHKTEEIITDATDQELFFDIPVSELLKQHNKFRETIAWEDDKGEEKTGLKEVRVRDLTMTVTTLAQF